MPFLNYGQVHLLAKLTTFRRIIAARALCWRYNLIKRNLRLPVLSFLLISLIACSQQTNAGNSQPSNSIAGSPTVSPTAASTLAQTAANGDLTQLFSRIWRVTNAPSQPASGSIYIFLPNGTLLETSCVETYRIATWTVDKAAPNVLRVVEDGQLVFTATIAELSDATLRLQKNLVPSNEKQDVTLTAVEQEFVCPDLPK